MAQSQQQQLLANQLAFAYAHGIIALSPQEHPSNDTTGESQSHGFTYKQLSKGNVGHLPFTASPSFFPKKCFQDAKDLTCLFNILLANVTLKESILTCLGSTAQSDPDFTGKIYAIWQRRDTHKSVGSMVIQRSDYLLHSETSSFDDASIKQIELNTVSSSFAHANQAIGIMHRILNHSNCYPSTEDASLTMENLTKAFTIAHNHFLSVTGVKSASILMIVQENERNIFDQYGLSFHLMKTGIKVLRRTFTQLAQQGAYATEPHLSIGNQPISIVYYRAGYVPKDYQHPQAWKIRAELEATTSIKCPNVAQHLIGAKKFQQLLANSKFLLQFVNKDQAKKLEKTFVGLYSLDADDPDTPKHVAMALKNPQNYVLKPQREGGGNNLYNLELKKKLESTKIDQLGGYILMERIFPPLQSSTFVRNGERIRIPETISELGTFGALVLSQTKEILCNIHCGALLRTKSNETDEGGVNSGYSVLDFPTHDKSCCSPSSDLQSCSTSFE